MQILKETLLETLYHSEGEHVVYERHRHRYEVNPEYVASLKNAGLVISGITPGMKGRGEGLVEAIELPDHPFFVGLQSPPEFKSRLKNPSPPFQGFIKAACVRAQVSTALETPV